MVHDNGHDWTMQLMTDDRDALTSTSHTQTVLGVHFIQFGLYHGTSMYRAAFKSSEFTSQTRNLELPFPTSRRSCCTSKPAINRDVYRVVGVTKKRVYEHVNVISKYIINMCASPPCTWNVSITTFFCLCFHISASENSISAIRRKSLLLFRALAFLSFFIFSYTSWNRLSITDVHTLAKKYKRITNKTTSSSSIVLGAAL